MVRVRLKVSRTVDSEGKRDFLDTVIAEFPALPRIGDLIVMPFPLDGSGDQVWGGRVAGVTHAGFPVARILNEEDQATAPALHFSTTVIVDLVDPTADGDPT